MTTAFQGGAFQNNAFQIDSGIPCTPAPIGSKWTSGSWSNTAWCSGTWGTPVIVVNLTGGGWNTSYDEKPKRRGDEEILFL